jgi:hypothetical protein
MDATVSDTSILTPLARMPTTMPKFASKIAKNIVGYAVYVYNRFYRVRK